MDETRHHFSSQAQRLHGPHEHDSAADTIVALRLVVMPERRPVRLAKPVVVVGRHSEAELRLAYPDVSRRHCRLVYADGAWQIHDLDSLNGVFVNGERMHEATLYEGDQLKIGAATLVVTDAPQPDRMSDDSDAEVLRSIAEALPLA